MDLIIKNIFSRFSGNYVINQWTYSLMDAILLSDPYMQNSTLVLNCCPNKVTVVYRRYNKKHEGITALIIKMFTDYINTYSINHMYKVYIVLNIPIAKVKYNFLPFFYLNLSDGIGLLLPYYNKETAISKEITLAILDEILYNYSKFNLRINAPKPEIKKGALLGKGCAGQIFQIINNPNKVLKVVKISLFYYTAFYEGVMTSITANNPMFLRLYDMYYTPHEAYFILERADCNLHEYHDKYGISKKIWKKIHDEIYAAMMELHRLNILHNDIKPKNIMYSAKHDKFFLIDFGMSEWLTPENKDKDFIMFRGIPNYLRIPEILKKYDEEGINYLKQSVPKDIYNKMKLQTHKNKFSTEESEQMMNELIALYHIETTNYCLHTYPNILFNQIII